MCADIAKCWGDDCPLKESCYRHEVEPNTFRQSYFAEPPIEKDSGKCNYYWPIDVQIENEEHED